MHRVHMCVAMLFVFLLMTAAACAGMTEDFSFEQLEGIRFDFSSGAGAWYEEMEIARDGSFSGEYHDSEMGEMGEAYPNGTVYGCLFHGSLTISGQVDAHHWRLTVEDVLPDEGQVPEAIEDGIRYVTAGPNGLTKGHEVELYLPGHPIGDLTEDARFWLHLSQEDAGEMTFYGIYDAESETGFRGE